MLKKWLCSESIKDTENKLKFIFFQVQNKNENVARGEGELLEIFMSTERVTRLDLFFPHFLRNCYFSPPHHSTLRL